MPAGPEQDPQPVLWNDYVSFRRYVLSACQRLKAPWPDDRMLGNEYIGRCRELAGMRAADEVAAFNARREAEEAKGR